MVRGIFFDEEPARIVAGLLVQDGYDAAVSQEPFAGEDDDEDHPWAVTTDAPAFQLELLLDAYDGWLESDTPAAPSEPLVLPTAPKRHHRPPASGVE